MVMLLVAVPVAIVFGHAPQTIMQSTKRV